jgi:hypothetical protein
MVKFNSFSTALVTCNRIYRRSIFCLMHDTTVMIEGCKCLRCGHVWVPRNTEEKPLCCAGCKSPYWNRPPLKKS